MELNVLVIAHLLSLVVLYAFYLENIIFHCKITNCTITLLHRSASSVLSRFALSEEGNLEIRNVEQEYEGVGVGGTVRDSG